MFYTNSALQHRNLNQDEWLAAEDWVKDLTLDSSDKISVFSGPIYGDPDAAKRFITPLGRPTAEIPAAFFKVAVFIGMDGEPTTRSFIFVQDRVALANKVGSRAAEFDLRSYQVSTRVIEEATGIKFPEILSLTNPISFGDVEPIVTPVEVVNPGDDRPEVVKGSQIFIAATLVNPDGEDRANEWVSIANYSGNTIDLTGWTLSDSYRQPLTLSGSLLSGETIRLNPLKSADGGEVQLGNSKGSLKLMDAEGRTFDRVEWSTKQKSGAVTMFFPH